MRIAGNIPYSDDRPNPMRTGVRQQRPRTGGTAPRCTAPTRPRPRQLREGAKLRLTPDGIPAGGPQRAGDHRLQRELVARAQRPAHALRPRAQRPLRRAPRALSGLERRAGLPDRAADRLRADREDPHGRVDAGDPGHQDDRRRSEGQLERPSGPRLADQAGHLAARHPRGGGHPEDDAGPPRRAVLADRGLRHRLPAASAASGRLPLRRPPERRAARPSRLPRHPGRDGRRRDARVRPARTRCTRFGISHPGAITLHNYPRSLQKLERDGEIIDLSVVDLVRTRRRGVPRYNDFRDGPAQAAGAGAAKSCARTRSRCAGCARSTAASTRSTRWSACSPRRRRRASASPTPRSGSSS